MFIKDLKSYPKLRGLMAEQNITQDELADILGMNRSTFNRKINSESDIFTLAECIAITRHFHTTLNDIFMPVCYKNETKIS
jgi:putative transcriptional regulator